MTMPTGTEIAVLAILVLVFFIWGPKKLPEMARSIGRLRRSFEQGKEDED